MWKVETEAASEKRATKIRKQKGKTKKFVWHERNKQIKNEIKNEFV